jgi:hypothetical protein
LGGLKYLIGINFANINKNSSSVINTLSGCLKTLSLLSNKLKPEIKMAKKLSIIRFKPKPEYYDTFLNDVVENGKDRDPEYPHFCVKAGDEVIAVVIRDADSFEQNAQDGVANWLDERRSMLQEYDPANRHTIPLSGDLVE